MPGKVYKSAEGQSDQMQGLAQIENGIMGATTIKRTPKAKVEKPKPKIEKVAIYSTKNVYWDEAGSVSKGYNIVTQEQADKWLTRGHTRIATPEEVAKEYGL